MKYIASFLSILFACISAEMQAQPCGCGARPDMADYMPCHKMTFDNGAVLYWSYNCDSSWLTFERSPQHKTIIFSLDKQLLELTGRLGYTHVQEYNSAFLVQNNVISGCCTPPEFHLYNKQTGKKLYELGRLIYYSDRKNMPFAIGIAYPKEKDDWHKGLKALIVYNLSTGKRYRVLLPATITYETLNVSSYDLNPEYLFEQAVRQGHKVTLQYITVSNGHSTGHKVAIDLDRCR